MDISGGVSLLGYLNRVVQKPGLICKEMLANRTTTFESFLIPRYEKKYNQEKEKGHEPLTAQTEKLLEMYILAHPWPGIEEVDYSSIEHNS